MTTLEKSDVVFGQQRTIVLSFFSIKVKKSSRKENRDRNQGTVRRQCDKGKVGEVVQVCIWTMPKFSKMGKVRTPNLELD